LNELLTSSVAQLFTDN
jgi:hypothetical protein